jgi:hypothetical protein
VAPHCGGGFAIALSIDWVPVVGKHWRQKLTKKLCIPFWPGPLDSKIWKDATNDVTLTYQSLVLKFSRLRTPPRSA